MNGTANAIPLPVPLLILRAVGLLVRILELALKAFQVILADAPESEQESERTESS